MANDKKSDTSKDKSIDDLLQEYAGDVKGNDLDDFLKHDDAFESGDADVSEEDEKAMADSGGKSGGFLTMMFIVLAFGAAGAGAYVYMNRDEGMTSIMGGFDAPAQTAEAPVDVAPDALPSMPSPIASDVPAPTPIMNDEAPSTDTLAMPEMTPPDGATQTAEAVAATEAATTLPPMPSPNATSATPPVDANASAAVDAWQSGDDAVIPLAPMEATAMDSKAPLPEKTVDVVNAKPPVKAADAAPKKKKEYSTMDDALSPPYVAIKEEKKAETKSPEKAVEKTAAAEPVKTEAKKAPAKRVERPEDAPYSPPAKAKMAPVVDSTASASVSARNENVSDVTKATGDTAKLVAQGGGKIDLSSGTANTVVPAPVSADMMPVAAASAAEPEMRTTALAIQGGRSMPDGTVVQTRTYAQVPNTDQGTKPADAVVAAPEAMSAKPEAAPSRGAQTAQEMEAEETRAVGMTKAAPVAEKVAAPVASAPVSSGNSDTDAKAVVAQAMAAEKSGDKQAALALFQKALEVDAVYGNGSSIDRGMIYDRIGSLRAGS